MKRILMLLLILPLALWCRPEKRLSLELSGLLEGISPADLNSFSEYDRSLFEAILGSIRQRQNPYWMVNIQEEQKDFKDLKGAQSLSARLRLKLGTRDKSPALSLGLGYLQKKTVSGGSLHVAYDSFYNGRYEETRRIDPHQLWVESWTPDLAFHLPLFVRSAFRLEASVSTGLTWASCGTFEADLYDKLEEYGYHYQTETIKRMKGKGIGLSAQAGLRIDYSPLKGSSLFLEGGYALRKVGKITGEASYQKNIRDNNQDGVSQQSSWEGEWLLQSGSYGSYPEVGWEGMNRSNAQAFKLDLSAFYLKMGISLGIF